MLKSKTAIMALLTLAALALLVGPAWSQQQPPAYPGNQNPAPGYPSQPGQQPGYPSQPGQQPGYPQQPAQPPNYQPQQPSGGGAAALADPWGRWQMRLPQGATPFAVIFNMGMPQAGVFINVQGTPNPQMFQGKLNQFRQMVRQMNAQVKKDGPMNLFGHQCHVLAVQMANQQTQQQMVSINVFVTGPGLWIQVMASADRSQQAEQVVNQIMQGLQAR